MNVQLIAAEIVRRVQGSPDSAHNLAQVVAGLIEQEMERDACEEPNRKIAAMKAAMVEAKSLLDNFPA